MLFILSSSWQDLPIDEKVYWCFAIPFSVILVLQLLLSFTGGDMDDSSDIDVDGGADFHFLSIKSLFAFFAIFGWVGIICSRGGYSVLITLLISLICGLLMMAAMATLLYFMGKLTESGGFDIRNTIGKTGTVYLGIPEKQTGVGQVQIETQGFQTLDAMTQDDAPLSTGRLVIVIDVINDSILLVEPTEKI